LRQHATNPQQEAPSPSVQAWRGRACTVDHNCRQPVVTQHPTPNAVGSLPCTLHSALDQGVCVSLCIRTNGHGRIAAAVAGCDTTASMDALLYCCGRRVGRGRGRAAAGRESWCAARGKMRDAKTWFNGIPRSASGCATHGHATPVHAYKDGRTSLMAVRGLNERGSMLAETRPCQ
jgi:hypothetical protein